MHFIVVKKSETRFGFDVYSYFKGQFKGVHGSKLGM